MTPTERHTEALVTLRVERDRLHHVYLPPLAARLRRLYGHAIRTLERHEPVWWQLAPKVQGAWLCAAKPCNDYGHAWPCPDAQSALDAITEAGS